MIMLVYILSNLMITSVAVITKEGKNVTIYMKSEYGIWIDEETGNFRVEEPRP